ncbi:MAG: hypothetical protein PHF70_00855 [Opitutales bacterium]|nr:hypothetical protein [Opitutales bacterium]
MTNSPNEVNLVNAVTLRLLGESAKLFCFSMKSKGSHHSFSGLVLPMLRPGSGW